MWGLLLIRTSLPIGLVGLHEASCSLVPDPYIINSDI